MTGLEIIVTSAVGVLNYVGSRLTIAEQPVGIDVALMAGEGLAYLCAFVGVLPPELGPVFLGLLAGSAVDAFHKSQTNPRGVNIL